MKSKFQLFSYVHNHDGYLFFISINISARNLNNAEKVLCDVVKNPQNWKLIHVAKKQTMKEKQNAIKTIYGKTQEKQSL